MSETKNPCTVDPRERTDFEAVSLGSRLMDSGGLDCKEEEEIIFRVCM